MNSLRRFFYRISSEMHSWLRAVTRRDRLEAEMEAELASHLESLTADLVRAGFSPAEARRRARIALGSTVVHKDEMRASLGLRIVDEFAADLRYAYRRLLAWTGTNAHVAVHHIWGDYEMLPAGRVTSSSFSYPVYQQLRTQNHD